MPTLMTYGDSNTHGTRPIKFEGQRRRLGPDQRWPGVVHKALGNEWTLIEEGLPGRTTRYPDQDMGPHMDGRVGLFIALESHGPIDAMTLMLGTNDVKPRFDIDARQIAEDVGMLLDIAQSEEMQDRHDGFDILLICPPPVLERGVLADKFAGSYEKSKGLALLIEQVAQDHSVGFLDAGKIINSSEIDGVHFESDQHALLGVAVAKALSETSFT